MRFASGADPWLVGTPFGLLTVGARRPPTRAYHNAPDRTAGEHAVFHHHQAGDCWSPAFETKKGPACAGPSWLLVPTSARSLCEHREHQQRNDVGDFDHGVHGRTGRILVWVAYGVAGDRGLVGLGSLFVFDTIFVDEPVFK